MKVVAFPCPEQAGDWTAAERETLLETLRHARRGRTSEVGMTESGDPQFYLLGPKPEQACELCVSRVDGRYLLEDGEGHLLVEHRDLGVVAAHLKTALRRPRSWVAARLVLLWCTVRQVIHDRVEPMLAEGEDLFVHLVPQLAPFA